MVIPVLQGYLKIYVTIKVYNCQIIRQTSLR